MKVWQAAGTGVTRSVGTADVILRGKLVQVARPTLEHSLLQGVVGTAWWLGIMFPDWYVLAPEDSDDQAKVLGVLFGEQELEELP